jgi:steroid delta-isomerase-like uncharacterized protein
VPEELKATIRRTFDEAYNKGNLDAFDEIYQADSVRHRPPLPDIVGLQAYKESISELRATYPDLRLTIHEILVDGDSSAVRWTMNGTHTGHGGSFPPTGRQVEFTGITVNRMVDGKIAENWANIDNLGVLQQLGVISISGRS